MKKLFTLVILPLVIIALAWLIYRSIQTPIEFNKKRAHREAVAIQKLKDIRTLQVAFKNQFGRFAPSLDTLKDFYTKGTMTIVKQIGSMDDSVAVARKLVRRENIVINVRDTLLKRENFNIDSLATIPYSGGEKIEMTAIIKQVSGVNVPLFEAKVPFSSLLKGMNHQLLVNLNAEREDTGRYPGLQVGSITAPNNNAGNWE